MSKQEPKQRSRQRTPNHRTTTRFRLSNELWAVLQPLLPVHVKMHRALAHEMEAHAGQQEESEGSLDGSLSDTC